MKIVLISCVKTKLPHRAKASALYTSSLFKGSLKFARGMSPDRIYILSAKYGLLELDEVVDPYEETLKGKSVLALRAWSAAVAQDLASRANLQLDHFVVLAGEPYRKYLLPYLPNHEVPLRGKSFGEQLSFYAAL